jgi:hypothetical protein
MQTPVDDSSIFTEVSRSAQAFPSPRWSPSQGISCKGQTPDRVTLWIAPGLPHVQVSLWCAFWQASPRPLLVIFIIKLPIEMLWALFPSYTVVPHHKCGWCGLARLTSPAEYNNGARKHRVVRGVQTSLNARPKPRASAYERGLANLSTLQSIYANH